MKKIAKFEIDSCDDREDLVAILGTNGYPVKVEKYYSTSNKYFVIVYSKEDV